MEEKESTVSGSPGGGNSGTDSPPPVSGGGGVVAQPFPVINMSAERAFGTATPPVPASESGTGDGKKKRGRPRKYDADGNLSAAYKAALAAKAAALAPPGFSLSPSSPPPSEYSSKRGRGKHSGSGSGNWQILASMGELFANTAGGDFMPHMVTVNTGEDVAAKILSFAQKGPRGVCVLSANGTVSNVTIRQPGSSGGILTYEGRFEILSLSGSFTVSDTAGLRTTRTGGLSVSLAGPDGRVVGGGIAGVLTAANPIQIVVGSFVPNGYRVQKKKHHRVENAMASIRSSAADTVTAARPISQADPDHHHHQVQSIFTPFQLQEQNHVESDNTSDRQMHFTTSYPNATWNGSEHPSDQRPTPSPDINLSVPLE